MNSHPLGLNVVYEIYDKGKLIRRDNIKKKLEDAIVQIKINNHGQPEKILRFPFRSYTSNFARVLQNGFLNVDNSAAGAAIDKVIKAVTGGITYPLAALHTMAVNEGALTSPAQTSFGIWIGDIDDIGGFSLTAEAGIGGTIAYNDYMLRRLILANGGSPNTNTNYGITNVTFSNSDNTLTISRRFSNVGSVDVNISEIGLVGKSGTDYFLIARDRVVYDDAGLYSGPFRLNIGGTIEVSYIFTIANEGGFTQNFLKMLSSEFVAGNSVSQVRDIYNAAQTKNFSTARTQKDLLALATDDTFGIQVGLGSGVGVVPNFLNTLGYNTSGFQAHSNTYLSYGAMTPIVLEQTLNKTTFGMYRDFENKTTASSISLTTTGLVIKETLGGTYYLIAHDGVPLANAIVLTPNQVLRVKYYFDAPLVPTI